MSGTGAKLIWKILRFEKILENADDTTFIKYLKSIADCSPCIILLSGGTHDCSNYSIACWDPYLIFRARGSNVSILTKGSDIKEFKNKNPVYLFSDISNKHVPDYSAGRFSFMGGAVGFISYEVKNYLERLPQNAFDDLKLPEMFFIWPQKILIHERKSGTVWYVHISPEREPEQPLNIVATELADSSVTVSNFRSNFERDEYIKAIETIIQYIKDGHVYQVNLSQRFEFHIECNPFETWISLYKRNPAPFYAFINGGDFHVLSTSMERFIYLRGNYIETRPIKGTRPRGKTRQENEKFRYDLLTNPKDDAELSMIVDLLRNDLGKICIPGTVKVVEHKRLETYQNVFHLISIIAGQLEQRVDYGDVIKAVFPGGSITGCPKIRAMEIIDELEPHVRHVYTGCIGYWGFHKNVDTNIAIRTMIVKGSKAYLSVGGGIVYDSDPQLEYEETLHKGRTFFEILKVSENA